MITKDRYSKAFLIMTVSALLSGYFLRMIRMKLFLANLVPQLCELLEEVVMNQNQFNQTGTRNNLFTDSSEIKKRDQNKKFLWGYM